MPQITITDNKGLGPLGRYGLKGEDGTEYFDNQDALVKRIREWLEDNVQSGCSVYGDEDRMRHCCHHCSLPSSFCR